MYRAVAYAYVKKATVAPELFTGFFAKGALFHFSGLPSCVSNNFDEKSIFAVL
jgi:hypothetical protein